MTLVDLPHGEVGGGRRRGGTRGGGGGGVEEVEKPGMGRRGKARCGRGGVNRGWGSRRRGRAGDGAYTGDGWARARTRGRTGIVQGKSVVGRGKGRGRAVNRTYKLEVIFGELGRGCGSWGAAGLSSEENLR